jgi:hypothetical protein
MEQVHGSEARLNEVLLDGKRGDMARERELEQLTAEETQLRQQVECSLGARGKGRS